MGPVFRVFRQSTNRTWFCWQTSALQYIDPFNQLQNTGILLRHSRPDFPWPISNGSTWYHKTCRSLSCIETGLSRCCLLRSRSRILSFSITFNTSIHANTAFSKVDSNEAFWNSGSEDPSLGGHLSPIKTGYFPLPPMDKHQDLRAEMVQTLDGCWHRDRSSSPRGW